MMRTLPAVYSTTRGPTGRKAGRDAHRFCASEIPHGRTAIPDGQSAETKIDVLSTSPTGGGCGDSSGLTKILAKWSEAQADISSARGPPLRRRRPASAAGNVPLASRTMPGSSATRYTTCTNGCVRKDREHVRCPLVSGGARNRQSGRKRWFARCASQLHPSIATKITAITRPRNCTDPRETVSHGRWVRTSIENESVSAANERYDERRVEDGE